MSSKKHKPLSQKALGIAQSLAVGKRLDEARATLRASNRSGYELTEEDKTKVKDCGGFSEKKGRFYVAPDFRGEFSKIPLGGTLS